MVTREDVAKRAHVSVATVSNVINNKPGVSKEVRELVWKAIDELGYKPNLVARSLKTRETNQIALVTNGISNPYFAELALGMEEEAFKNGYIISILNAREDKEYIDELIKRQFDGIVMSTDKLAIEDVNRFTRYRIPTVFVGNEGYKGFDPEIILVNLDLYAGAVKLLEYVVNSGHRRIGFLTARRLRSSKEPDYRLQAYRKVLSDHGIEFDPDIVYIDGDTPDYAYSSVIEMLTRYKRPTAIFTGNDYLAPAVYSAINDLMLKIPYDVSVVGFDNLNLSRYLTPPLTTVHVPHYELGKKVMELLLKKIKGDKVQNVNMETMVIVRKSLFPKK
ncbi:MAG: LacI family DNA-binding transcriptional regulator [Caldicoprobacterales bacterium]|mgnify:CR=1 FL=1|jgi:DNA-binding LacI/PurR family transcriptional regulator|nr:LacI family transcriptional regulator [Clostridiales bacterium]